MIYWLLDGWNQWQRNRRPGRKVMVRILHPKVER